jgi:uncharacterized membrane protein YbhN (UPF0104 family)
MSDTSDNQPPTKPAIGFSWKIVPMALVTALVIYLLVEHLAGAEELKNSIQDARWEFLPLVLALLGVNLVLAGTRWMFVVRAMGFDLGLRRAMDAMLSTWPLAVITPSRASDLLRSVCIRDMVPTMEASSSVLAEKVVDVQSLCLLALVGSALVGAWTWAGIAGLMLLGAWMIVALLFWKSSLLFKVPVLGRFEDKIRKLFAAFAAFRQSPVNFLYLSVISMASWMSALAVMYTLTLTFQADISLLKVVALWPLAIFVGMLPLTVAGMGTRDAAFITLLQWTSAQAVGEASVLAATLGYALVASWLPALIGIPLMIRRINNLPEPIAAVDEQTAE